MKPLLRLRPYLWKYRRTLAWGLVTVVASNLFTVVQPYILGKAIDELKLTLATGRAQAMDFLSWAGLIVAFAMVAGFFTFLTRQTIIVVSRHIEFDLRNDLLAHLQKLPYGYFQNTSTGDLMAHATNDISAVRTVVGPGIMYPTDTFMTFSMVLVMMMVKDWQLTLLALLPLPLVSVVVYRMGKVINKKFTERQEQFSLLTTRAQENLSGIRVIKAYVREAFEIDRFRVLSFDYLKKNLVLARVQAVLWPLMFLLVGSSILITLYVGGTRVISAQEAATGSFTIGDLTAFMAYLVMLIWPMIAFGWVINLLQQGAASMKRLAAIFDTLPSIRDTERTRQDISELKGEIEFRNVSFTHANSPESTLKDLSLTIRAGMTLAIVGYTGSGKTTMVNLIPRLYDVTGGQLFIDGTDVRDIPLDVLRSHISLVPQETFLFSDTIGENIRYGAPGGSEEEMQQAAEISKIDKDVVDFPRGFDTFLGERGITLSGGQKQRTSIARALMRNPRILILDDALSSVDTVTEEEILSRLRSFMRERTSIIISHRISTVKDADHIVVLHNGAITEQGTHQELIERRGIYADLHEKQLLEQQLENL